MPDLKREIKEATALAWAAAARNKFWMMGYYAARVHYLRHLLGETGPGPFIEVRNLGRAHACSAPRVRPLESVR